MVDLHCHILPGVDDGSMDIEETIAILKKAKKAGFDTICMTPHYAEPDYLKTKGQNYEILKCLEEMIQGENIGIRLLLGNEVFICGGLENLLEKGEISSLADSHYVLIEVPMYQQMPQEIVQEILKKVKEKGFQVVIAHPERYAYIQNNPEKILEYFGKDVIFQGNYASILGAYGREAQKTIKKFLKDKIIHYLSSDVHHINRCFYSQFDLIQKKLLKVTDEEYFEVLTQINPRLIIEDKEIVKNNRIGDKT